MVTLETSLCDWFSVDRESDAEHVHKVHIKFRGYGFQSPESDNPDLILPRLDHDLAEKFNKPIHSPEIGALIFAKQRWLNSKDNLQQRKV